MLWPALFVSALFLLAVATLDTGGAETDGERVQRLSESFACPTCDGQSVAESNAAVAAQIRNFIRAEVSDGATDTEIRDALIVGYTSSVLLTPPSGGVSSLIWILPVLVLVGGSAGVGFVLTRPRSGSRDATEDDEALVARARASIDDGTVEGAS